MSEDNKNIEINLTYSNIEYLKLFFKSFTPSIEYLEKQRKEIDSKLFYVHYTDNKRKAEDVEININKYKEELYSFVENCLNYAEIAQSYCNVLKNK